jgi:hypothetical protein
LRAVAIATDACRRQLRGVALAVDDAETRGGIWRVKEELPSVGFWTMRRIKTDVVAAVAVAVAVAVVAVAVAVVAVVAAAAAA